MKGLLEPLKNLESYNVAIKSLTKGENILLNGVVDSQKCHLIAGFNNDKNKNGLIIASNEQKAREIYDDLKFFLGEKVLYYPTKDILFYSADVKSIDITNERFGIINKLMEMEDITIVVSIEGLFDRLISVEKINNFIVDLEVGDVYPLTKLVKKLTLMGYKKREKVEACGQFSVRGGILDLFTSIHDTAIRIEYWDDEIDSIRLLDSYSQRSIEKINKVKIFPVRELCYTEGELSVAISNMTVEYEKSLENFTKKGLHEEKQNLIETFEPIFNDLSTSQNSRGIERFVSYFYDEKNNLLDYLNKDKTIVYIDEPVRTKSHSENVYYEFSDSVKSKILRGYMMPSMINMLMTYDDVMEKISKFQSVLLSTLYTSFKDSSFHEQIDFNVKSANILKNRIDLLTEDLEEYKKSNYMTVILSGNKSRGTRLVEELEKDNIAATYYEDIQELDLIPKGIYITKGSLNKGFIYPNINLAILSDKELFGEEKKKRKKRKKNKGAVINSFSDLKVGDYVVHENHGIGIFMGTEKIDSAGISKDYIKIMYANDGNLFIPITQLEKIQKYIGSENVKLKINSLSNNAWEKTKAKTKKVVEALAMELVELYAKRRASVGFAYSKDNAWQKEFEDMFPYDETDDQLEAIKDVKLDMEEPKVMDRLICGDVGYGKTEIAIRAAFKAVQDGKQVAYLVPTTILAQQHYNTFKQRMKDYPINIELFSRFRKPKEIKASLNNLSTGYGDIAIGTHRILSKDVKFKDLGLIIVDEEQRFGVTHKEKLKLIKENCDVLTLTATPIPRTLHMSLTGIRDISVLEDPPSLRIPIQTFVMEYNEEFIKDACNRELARGGQVFFLHNRVRNIEAVAFTIQELLPEANVSFAHGQMSVNELEDIMKDFIEGEIDVLVCTTIIETGLDISNANTIIINNADTMGLSQLYQLRGRVGRSTRGAYAYLMYKKDKVVSEIAEKRLETIKEFTEFGSGFKISMRDLEIRGSGSVLGEQQHGHMDTVGYDLYCKLLDEAVKRINGEVIPVDFDTKIDINISGFIPQDFIKDEMQRLEIYKKISFINTFNDYDKIYEEIEDRYGDLPAVVINLLKVALVKSISHSTDIISIIQKKNEIIFKFKNDAKMDVLKVQELIKEYRNILFFAVKQNPTITYKLKSEVEKIDMDYLLKIVEGINKCMLEV